MAIRVLFFAAKVSFLMADAMMTSAARDACQRWAMWLHWRAATRSMIATARRMHAFARAAQRASLAFDRLGRSIHG